ncbi:25988_t:CDS:2, partial [Dentiscutata erythropus]
MKQRVRLPKHFQTCCLVALEGHWVYLRITFTTEAATDLEEAEEQEKNQINFQRTALNTLKIKVDAGHKFA